MLTALLRIGVMPGGSNISLHFTSMEHGGVGGPVLDHGWCADRASGAHSVIGSSMMLPRVGKLVIERGRDLW